MDREKNDVMKCYDVRATLKLVTTYSLFFKCEGNLALSPIFDNLVNREESGKS